MRILAALLALPALLSLGCTAMQAAPRASAPLRVVSYNIKHGRGLDGRVDLDRTRDVLRALDADVVLLQEVDEVCERSGGVDQARALGDALGMEARFCSFMDYQGGRYGLALLSALPVEGWARIDLPDGTDEPRAALGVVVVAPGGQRVRIVNCHLDWKSDPARRIAQARVPRAALEEGADAVDRTLLGGDVNARIGSPALGVFTEGAGGFERLGPDAPTFPADVPDRTIDHFLVLPPGRDAAEVSVVDEALASDHRPVVLEVRFGDGGGR
ncbi:MAG: endonuclease/exonuclease/phosphatase family protein [Planctomycetota bacterium]